ncbi:MAG TPA: tRNA (N6-threonylcarbamoyladenosine(37)-N6)-methyltransferase TrmO [Labilithrix sp.]|nr:tRNA (N6-threonylcarbamoyladenosine(37)-N6)-methyltransferase TrmO [Labilithrix sp.]
MSEPYVVRPIGFVRSPFVEKVEAPRQAVAAGGALGRIELLPEHEHALEDLATFERLWVIFWFHQVPSGPSPSKVLPPRSDRKRGVFATRSPHRPNPIGLSAVRLERIEGRVVHIRDLDLIDGTPVLDLKPYVPYADAFPEANAGWLDTQADPKPSWDVAFTELAEAQLAWLAEQGLGLDLRARIVEALGLGPQPHPYRRIKKSDAGDLVLAVKEWRARFVLDGRTMTVEAIFSGFRPRELASGAAPQLAVHRAFVTRFG